jgi:hypothetical protein
MTDDLPLRYQTVFTFASSDLEIMSHVLELQTFFNTHHKWPALSLPDVETVPPPPRPGQVTGIANLRTRPTAVGGQATILAVLNVGAPAVEVVGEDGDYYFIRAWLWKQRITLTDL